MKKTTIIIKNETHDILPDQAGYLPYHRACTFFEVPAKGWSLEQIVNIANEILWNRPENFIISVSPVPVLLGLLAAGADAAGKRVYVFHNDHREKKELPDGKIIMVVAKTGWKLVKIAGKCDHE